MKKLISICLAISTLFSLYACTQISSETETEEFENETPDMICDFGAQINDIGKDSTDMITYEVPEVKIPKIAKPKSKPKPKPSSSFNFQKTGYKNDGPYVNGIEIPDDVQKKIKYDYAKFIFDTDKDEYDKYPLCKYNDIEIQNCAYINDFSYDIESDYIKIYLVMISPRDKTYAKKKTAVKYYDTELLFDTEQPMYVYYEKDGKWCFEKVQDFGKKKYYKIINTQKVMFWENYEYKNKPQNDYYIQIIKDYIKIDYNSEYYIDYLCPQDIDFEYLTNIDGYDMISIERRGAQYPCMVRYVTLGKRVYTLGMSHWIHEFYKDGKFYTLESGYNKKIFDDEFLDKVDDYFDSKRNK